MNNINLLGRAVSTPELKHTNSGKEVASFALAVDRKMSREKATDFIPVVCWGKTATFAASYFQKGQLMALTGSLQVRKYDDKDGNKRTAFEVVAEQLYFAESKNKGDIDVEAEPSFQNMNSGDFEEITGDEDDLPF